VQIVGFIICKSRTIERYRNENLKKITQNTSTKRRGSNAHLLLCSWMHCTSGKSLLNSTESDFLRILFIQTLFSLLSSTFIPPISFPQLRYNSELNYTSDGTLSNLTATICLSTWELLRLKNGILHTYARTLGCTRKQINTAHRVHKCLLVYYLNRYTSMDTVFIVSVCVCVCVCVYVCVCGVCVCVCGVCVCV
jgi:hypothetical protein